MKFRLTYSIVTEESSQHGDHAFHGFVTRNLSIPRRTWLPDKPAEFPLRKAIDFLLSRNSSGPVEADCCPVSESNPPRWFTYGGSLERNGDSVQVSLHLPRSISAASALRIARLLNCYGISRQIEQRQAYQTATAGVNVGQY